MSPSNPYVICHLDVHCILYASMNIQLSLCDQIERYMAWLRYMHSFGGHSQIFHRWTCIPKKDCHKIASETIIDKHPLCAVRVFIIIILVQILRHRFVACVYACMKMVNVQFSLALLDKLFTRYNHNSTRIECVFGWFNARTGASW